MPLENKYENTLQKRVLRDLKGIGVFCYKAMARSIRGIPDIICCINGFFVALELKVDKTSKITKIQELTLEQITNAGGIGLVVTYDNWSEIYDLIKPLQGRKDVHYPTEGIALREAAITDAKVSYLCRLQEHSESKKSSKSYKRDRSSSANISEGMGSTGDEIHKEGQRKRNIPCF